MHKKYSILILLLALLLLCGCAKESTDVVDIGTDPAATPLPEAQLPAVTPQPHMDAAATPPPKEEEAPAGSEEVPVYGTSPKAEVMASVAYAFAGEGDAVTLYGAAEYKNTGDCPMVLTEAAFTFTHAGGTVEHIFAPPLASYEVLLPGESGYLTLFLENAAGVAAGGEVNLSAALICEAAAEERILLQVDHIYLADNYPGFTTMTGTLSLTEEAECEMNMVYVGFYDEEGSLLGVWNFTKSARFEGAGDAKSFTVHMRALPIDDLAAKAASTNAVAFGFR